ETVCRLDVDFGCHQNLMPVEIPEVRVIAVARVDAYGRTRATRTHPADCAVDPVPVELLRVDARLEIAIHIVVAVEVARRPAREVLLLVLVARFGAEAAAEILLHRRGYERRVEVEPNEARERRQADAAVIVEEVAARELILHRPAGPARPSH